MKSPSGVDRSSQPMSAEEAVAAINSLDVNDPKRRQKVIGTLERAGVPIKRVLADFARLSRAFPPERYLG